MNIFMYVQNDLLGFGRTRKWLYMEIHSTSSVIIWLPLCCFFSFQLEVPSERKLPRHKYSELSCLVLSNFGVLPVLLFISG